MIRDESQNVARKARTRLDWRKEEDRVLDIVKFPKRQSDFSSEKASSPIFPYYTFPVSVEDQGFCFCFSRYIVADSTLPNGHPDYFSSKTFKIASLSEVLRDALTSVGLAALSNVRNSRKSPQNKEFPSRVCLRSRGS